MLTHTMGIPIRKVYLQRWGAGPQSGAAFRGLAGGFEGAGATAQEEGKRAGPWLWQGGRVPLPLARAAAVSTGLRVRQLH